MNAINNPYMLLPPPTDTTLTQEGVAADAKAVGDALGEKSNKVILKSTSYSGRTDQYSQISARVPDDAIAVPGIVASDTNIYGRHRQKPTYAHREQVHGCVYVPAHRLTPKGVAV